MNKENSDFESPNWYGLSMAVGKLFCEKAEGFDKFMQCTMQDGIATVKDVVKILNLSAEDVGTFSTMAAVCLRCIDVVDLDNLPEMGEVFFNEESE